LQTVVLVLLLLFWAFSCLLPLPSRWPLGPADSSGTNRPAAFFAPPDSFFSIPSSTGQQCLPSPS